MSYGNMYNDYIAKTGAGFDAAGRPNFNPAGYVQGDPRATDHFMLGLKNAEAAAMQEETEEQTRVRKLLDQLAQYNPPGNARYTPPWVRG